MTSNNLHDLGYDTFLDDAFQSLASSGRSPARVSVQFRKKFTLLSETGAASGKVTGRFHHDAREEADYPAVGDWVVAEAVSGRETNLIHSILPRRGVISRKMAGLAVREQIVATNINTLFIVTSLDGDYNLPRIERYLALARISQTAPVILLNKSDLVDDATRFLEDTERVAEGAPVYTLSALTDKGTEVVFNHLGRGVTGALIGSSGVGKSTLINCLVGEEIQPVGEVHRKTERGTHTTTRREMIPLGDRGILVDTPGLREVHLWADNSIVSETFEDLERLAESCRFNNCRHETEPGCAVLAAIEAGDIDGRRLINYRKLQAEMKRLSSLRERHGRGGRRGPGQGREG